MAHSAPHSSDQKLYTTQAFCLKTWDYGEADKVVHLFSPEHGQISAIAKGVKKQKSKLAGACELLHLSQVQLSRGKNLDLLVQYESIESFPQLRLDILKLGFALLFADLVHLLVKAHEPDSHEIFDLLHDSLAQLDAAPEDGIIPIGSRFQLELLEITGYQPSLIECIITGQPLDPTAPYYPFSVELGGAALPQSRIQYPAYSWINVSTKTLFGLAGLLTTDTPSALTQTWPELEGEYTGQSQPAISWHEVNAIKAQKFLRHYFSQKLEHPIKAYDFLFQLLGNNEPAENVAPGLRGDDTSGAEAERPKQSD